MRIASIPSRRQLVRRVLSLCALLTALAANGCTFYHSLGKGQHLEPARPRPHHDVNTGGEEILVEVTTDAEGTVNNLRFLKPSRSDAVNNYVAESIRSTWPGAPSTRSVARLKHSHDGGFGQPEIVSSEPVQ